MVKKILKIIVVFGLLIAIFTYWAFCRIPKGGELLTTYVSPKGEYTIYVYLHTNSLSSDAIRCEVLNQGSGKTKNIYWDYPQNAAYVRWVCEDTVDINGIVLNVEKDKYDFRWD